MPDIKYTSPLTQQSYTWSPKDPAYTPTEDDYKKLALKVEQIETGTEQSALGAMASSAAQGLTSIPGTVAQGVGALTGITSLEESGKYFADQARALTPIDPMRREDFSTKAAGAVGQAVGQLGAALATGGGSIGTGVVLGMAGAMGAASGAESAEARGLEGVRRYGEVLGYGATEIVSERLFGLGSKSFFKPATDFQAKVLKTGKTIGGEAVEEAGAGLGTNIVSNLTALGTNIPTPDILSAEAFKGYAEQALLGAVGGTVFAGAQLAMKTQATEQTVTRKTAVVDGQERDVTGVSDEDLVSRGVDPTTIKVQTVFTQADAQAVDQAPTAGSKKIVEEVLSNELEVPSNVIEEPSSEQKDIFAALTEKAAAEKAAAEKAPPTIVTPAAETPITPPAVEPTPTPTPDATQIGNVTESDLGEYTDGNEVGPTAEAGDRNRPVEGGQVEQTVAQEQAVTPFLPSGATPTEPGTLPTTPMTGVSGAAAAPTGEIAVGENTLGAVINTPGQGPIATKAQTLLENVKRNIKAGIPPTASLTPDGNVVFPTPEAAPGVPQQARRTPLNSAVVKQSVQKVFGIVPKNIEFIDTDERVDGKAFVKEQRVQINLRYIQSKERLEEVLREEAFHLIYQDPLVQADVDLLKQEIPDDIKAEIDQLYSDPRFTDSVRLEESVARLVERLSEKTAWQRFVGSVRAAFQKLFGRPPSPRELTLAANRILERAIANVAVQQTGEMEQGADQTRAAVTPKSPEAIRHGELEAKFNAGTITPQEEAEAKQLVQQRAQANSYNRKGVRFGFYVNGVPLPPSRAANLNFGPGYYVAEDASLDVKASNVSVSKKLNLVELKRLGLDPENVEYREDSVFVKAATPYRSEYGSNATPETKAFIEATFAYESAIQEANRRLGLPTEPTNYGTVIADLIAQKRIPFDSTQGMTGRKGMTSELVVQNASQIKSAQTFNGIPLDERFDARKDDIRYSVTPESQRIDQEYLAAVEAGDMETAQRLVKEAATKAGYNVGPVYHGTPMGGFTAFDKKYQGQTGGISRGGFSFTTNKEAARTYAEANTEESVTLSEALRIANTSLTEVEDQEALEAFFIEKGYDGIPEYSWEAIEDPQEFANFLLDFSEELPPSAASAFKEAANLIFNGYGFKPEVKEVFLKIGENPLTFTATPKTLGKVVFGLDVRKTETKSAVVNLGGGEQIFYVAEPNQIKSADPVTYDDAGNIIPPSKRFQKTSDDIRYSVTPTAEDANESEKYFPPTVQVFGEKIVATAVEVQSYREVLQSAREKVFDSKQEVTEDSVKAARDVFDRIRPTEDGPADIAYLKEMDSSDAFPGAVLGVLYEFSDKMQDGGRFQQEILDAIELSKYFTKESFIDFWTQSGIGGNVREAGRGLGVVGYVVSGLNKLLNVHSNRRIRIEAASKELGISKGEMRDIDNVTSVAPSAEAVAEGMGEIAAKIEKTLLPPGSNDPTKNPDNSPATDPKSIEQISAQKLVKDATKKDKKPKDTTQTDAVTAIVQDHLEKKGGQLEADLTRKLTEAGMSPEAAKKLATNTEKKLERDAKKESEREAKALEGAKELSDADRVARRITKKLLSTKDEAAKRKIHPIVALVARYFKANGKLSEEQLENELTALGVSTEIGRELVDAATAELGKRQAIKAARDKARRENAATKSAENFTKNWEKSQDPAQQTKEKAPDPVRAFLNDQSKVVRGQIHFDLSPNGKALFFDTVYTRLVNLNVSPEAAMAATSAAYQKYLTNRANQIAKLRDTVAKEGLAKALAKQILNISRAQQRDPEFAKQFIEQTLIDAGVPQDVANASVPLLLPSFQKTLADAREKALIDFINGRPPSAKRIPKEKLDDLRKAVRLGATNPDYQPSTPFAKANGWQNFTRAEHDEMALQDEIASDPLQTNQERQLALSKIAKIAAKRMPKNNKLSLFAEIYRNSALSNFLSTGGIQVWTPVFSAAVRSFTDGVRGLTQEKNLNRFIASLEGFLRAASPTALKAELTSSFGQNITTYNKAYEIDDLSQLHALLLDGVETWKTTKSPLKKAKALISITYGSMDYVRRSYASLDNVSQSVFYRQIMDLGMRDIILSKGGSETDFKNLISNRTRRHEQIVIELISQGQSPSRAWVNASELSYREMNGDLVDLYGEDVAVEIQAKDEMSRKESARELGVAPDEELDGHVIPVLIDTIKGLSKAADKRFAESGKLTTLILFGFPVTALKVMNRSLDYSPIGILRGVMSERESKQFANDPEYKSKYPSYKTDTQKQQRAAEAAVGTAAMIMFLMIVLNERDKEPEDRMFMVHNAGPRDRAARQIWRAAGNEPQSVQFRFSKDSPWLGVSWAKAGLEVFTPVFAVAGSTFDSMDPAIRREDTYDQIMVFFSQTLASMSRPLSSVQDTAGVVSGKEMSLSGRSLANQIGFRASSFLPWSSMARNYNKWQGARDTTNAGSAFAAMIPIVGPSLTEPALNSLGDPVGKTPNEYSYKLGTAIPVSVGLRREDTPLYEFLLNKGKFPTTISRPTQEKKYGQMTNETWRKFVEIRGKTLKSLILQRKESLDKMDSEKYDDMIENLTRIANDRARNELKLRPAK